MFLCKNEKTGQRPVAFVVKQTMPEQLLDALQRGDRYAYNT
jgi:hypothetical protein